MKPGCVAHLTYLQNLTHKLLLLLHLPPPPDQLGGVGDVDVPGPASLAVVHLLAGVLAPLRVTLGQVEGGRGLGGLHRPPLEYELLGDLRLGSDLLLEGSLLVTQLHLTSQARALHSQVHLDVFK